MDQSKQPSRSPSPTLNGDDKPEAPAARSQYAYVDKRIKANPDAQPKKKGKLSSFLSKFQSPAVKASTAIREREMLEQERTGVVKVSVTDTNRSSNAWVLS
ncbi:hypothetical protein QBC34DRAFT_406708 [Podospora aff. communis PSN243]|uniref:Uncharacterized protein n=1 Tax=Podospora aff. communis PSN243 TaxID=3040156 RepID=A0AAV9GMR4_9PEZI|nr:hypothetical protein QBC34DRAFT_406708 [Podospora aff. communis PSN243]